MLMRSPEVNGVRAIEAKPTMRERFTDRLPRVVGGLAVCAIAATMIAPSAANAEVPQNAPIAPVAVQVEQISAVDDFLNGLKNVVPGSQAAIEMVAPENAKLVADLSGANSQLDMLGGMKGTDLGITFKANGGTGFLVGDSFDTSHPNQGAEGWQSNGMFHSSNTPDANTPMQFDYAYGANGGNEAPELIKSPKDTSGFGEGSAIPNDVVQLSNGDMVMSYQSVRHWNGDSKQEWVTNYMGMAVSKDGGHTWDRDAGPKWMNDEENNSPDQMASMQLDDDGFVYMASTKAGRQDGEMVMKRVHENNILDQAAYEDLGVLFTGNFGEPSLRKISDGTWVMTYLDKTRNAIFSRTASGPMAGWSAEKVQVTGDEATGGKKSMYGGFIDHRSTAGNLVLSVSQWTDEEYKIMQFGGTTYGHW